MKRGQQTNSPLSFPPPHLRGAGPRAGLQIVTSNRQTPHPPKARHCLKEPAGTKGRFDHIEFGAQSGRPKRPYLYLHYTNIANDESAPSDALKLGILGVASELFLGGGGLDGQRRLDKTPMDRASRRVAR